MLRLIGDSVTKPGRFSLIVERHVREQPVRGAEPSVDLFAGGGAGCAFVGASSRSGSHEIR